MGMRDLDADRLAAAAETLASGPPRPTVPLGADDGSRAVRHIETILEGRA